MTEKGSSPRRVLLVGGDAAKRARFEDVLARLGGTFTVTDDGGSAADRLTRQPIDLLVLGAPWNGAAGAEFLERLRRAGTGPLPTIVLGGR
jgi:CheY-like chemotaxis protein